MIILTMILFILKSILSAVMHVDYKYIFENNFLIL